MRTLLVAINSRNLHTNLAVRYLYVSCKEESLDVELFEGNINTGTEMLISQIYRDEISVYCFSTYIWNITEILKISDSIRKLNSSAKIIFGGPEATFRYEEFLYSKTADFVVRGDGERLLPVLLERIAYSECMVLEDTPHNGSNIKINLNELGNVPSDEIPFPYSYDSSLLPSKDQLLYYETSRGCPFSCSYCLSSSMYAVNYRSLDKVFKEVSFFIDNQVPLVKFVDRTWNGNRDRARKMIEFILDNPSDTRFHFEAAGDLFDDELLGLMKKLPVGAVQLEIGVQSANVAALEAACRKTDIMKLKRNIEEIISWGNIHVHLDLIAGLPFENFESFADSFDFVFAMKSQMLQLGFLKLLHGSNLKQQESQYGIVGNSFPPYEVLKTNDISYKELLILKSIEDVLEHYYNSGKSRTTIDFLISHFSYKPFAFFMEFTSFLSKHGFFERKRAPKESFAFLYEFCQEKTQDGFLTVAVELLQFDWITAAVNSPLPAFMQEAENSDIKKNIKEYLVKKRGFDLKECNWMLIKAETVHYLLTQTTILAEYDKLKPNAETAGNLLLIFNSTKGKKIDSKLLDVVPF